MCRSTLSAVHNVEHCIRQIRVDIRNEIQYNTSELTLNGNTVARVHTLLHTHTHTYTRAHRDGAACQAYRATVNKSHIDVCCIAPMLVHAVRPRLYRVAGGIDVIVRNTQMYA